MPPSGIKLDKLIVEARARITWGDRPEAVRAWLIAEKVYDFEADDILRDLLAARGASMRRRGAAGIAVAAAALAVSVALVFAPWYLDQRGIPVKGEAYGLFWAGAVLCGMTGAKQLADGLERVLRGARAEGADSDLENT